MVNLLRNTSISVATIKSFAGDDSEAMIAIIFVAFKRLKASSFPVNFYDLLSSIKVSVTATDPSR